MFDAKYIFLPFKQPKICKRFKFAVYKRTLRFFLLFINYFTSDFHPFHVYVFMQGSSNSILLVNWKYLPFYFNSPPTSNTFFSSFYFFEMQEINSFSCPTLSLNTFYSRAHTYPPKLFTFKTDQ